MAYIGRQQDGFGVRSRFIYTATGGQTTFDTDDSSNALSYSDGAYVDVYLNGVLLDPSDYTATSLTSIVLDAGAAADDVLEVIVYDVFSVFSGTFTNGITASEATVTGDLTVDTNTLFVDSTNNNVGVGTTSLSAGRTLTINHATEPTQSFEQNGTEKHLSGIAGSASFGINGSASGDYFARTSGGKMLFSTDTGTTAHATLDGSGNLLVGKTSVGTGTAGVQMKSDGETAVTRSGTPLIVNRLSSDGTITQFRKDGTTVGSINSRGGEFIAIGYSDTYLEFNAGSNQINPSTGSAARDNAIDLGNAFARFNDLYLGGSVYLGGTGSANALDDYEEGSWTPTAANGFTGLSFDSGTCKYTKIGNTVHVWGEIYNFTGTSSGIWQLNGLPFNVNKETAFSVMFQNVNLDSGYTALSGYCLEGTNDIRMYETGDNIGWGNLLGNQTGSSSFFIFCLTYFV